jgi:hypothetical protein
VRTGTRARHREAHRRSSRDEPRRRDANVNLIHRVVQVHTKPPKGPLGHNYAEIRPYPPGAEIELRLDGKLVDLVSLADVFPPREEPTGGG